jgi:hypothetical protein
MSPPQLTRGSAKRGARYKNGYTTATLAQKLAGLRRMIQYSKSLRKACAWVNQHSPDPAKHELKKGALANLYDSLPYFLRRPCSGDEFNEVQIIDFMQYSQARQRRTLAQSLSLLTDPEDTMLCVWIQQRANMNCCAERCEIISTARLIMERVRGIKHRDSTSSTL